MSDLVRVDPAGMRWLVSRAGPAASLVWQEGHDIWAGARSGAPVLSGNLVEHITLTDGEDARGYYVDVTTGAANDAGYAYGTAQEIDRPYLEPALEREVE